MSNLYSIEIRVVARGDGAEITREPTFYASASTATIALDVAHRKAKRWAAKEFNYLPNLRTTMTVLSLKLEDEDWQ